MHETPQIVASFPYAEGLAAQSRNDSGRLERNSNRRAAAAFGRLEIYGCQPSGRCQSSSGCGLDSQSQPEGARQCGRRTSSWQTYTDGSYYPAQVGSGIDKISARFWVAAHSLGWSRGGRVSAKGLQRSTATATGTQLVEAPRVRFEAAYLPIHSSDEQRRWQISPRAQKKLHRILDQGELALLVFADESGFSLHPKLGRVWARRGSQPTVPTTSQHHKRLNLFGWVDPLYGWHGLFRWPKGNREGFLAFLKYLCHRVKGWKVYLYVDGAPWHKGQEIKDFLAQHREVQMEYLPPYHPELNAQERVWHLIRYEVTTNRYHGTIDLIEQAIRKRQRRWRPNKICALCKVI